MPVPVLLVPDRFNFETGVRDCRFYFETGTGACLNGAGAGAGACLILKLVLVPV